MDFGTHDGRIERASLKQTKPKDLSNLEIAVMITFFFSKNLVSWEPVLGEKSG